MRPARAGRDRRATFSPKPTNSAARGGGVARRLQRLPVGLGLHPAADPALRGASASWSAATTSSANGTAAASPIPPRRRVDPHQDPGAGQREEREPGECLRDVVARVVTDLVGEDDARPPRPRSVPSTIVLHSTTLRERAEADGVGIRLARRAADVLDRDRDPRDALLPLERLRRAPQRGVLERGRLGHEIRLGEREHRSDRDERGRAGDPPHLADPTGEEHHDQQRDADDDERAAELEPVAERPLEVARLGQVVAPRPPDVERARTAVARARRSRARACRGACRCRSGRPPTRARSAAPRRA